MLARIVEEFAATPLDRSKPLWEMLLVEGLEDGRCALVTKLHHCMIDGATGASQMANLLDFAPDTPPVDPPRFRPGKLPSTWALIADEIQHPRDPRDLTRMVRATATAFFDSVRANGLASFLPDAPRTPWSGPAGSERHVAFGSAPLDDVKLVSKAFGVTVNDAVLTACALALRRYLQGRDALPAEPLACAMPISMKSEDELRQFSNKVTVMTVRLPTHLDDPKAMALAVQRETGLAKHAFQASDPELMLDWLDWAPGPLVAAGARLFTGLGLARHLPMPWNCVVSNMRGAPFPLYFAGAQVLATYPMGPAGDGVGLNITVLSNMGRLDFGVLAAGSGVPDPWALADGFAAAVAELRAFADEAGV